MKSTSKLHSFLFLAGSSLLSITSTFATEYYWDANDGSAGFQNSAPGTAGSWSSSTPSTATGGFSTDSSGSTVISGNGPVATTTSDDVFFGTGSLATSPPVYPYDGKITIDGTVNVRKIYQSQDSPSFGGTNTPTIHFAAEGIYEHATVDTITFPALTITGAGTSLTWKPNNSVSIQNIIANGAAKNILQGPGRLVVNNTAQLGALGTPFVFDGGRLRMNNGITWTNFSQLNADHPLTFTSGSDAGIDYRVSNTSFTVDRDLSELGTGGFNIETAGSSEVIMNLAYQYTGPTTLGSGTTRVETPENLSLPASNLVFFGGTLKIMGTTLTNFSTLGHTVIFTTGRGVGLNINEPTHTFTVDQPLNMGTSGTFTKTGPGTVIVDYTGSDYTAATTVSGGTLLASNSALSGPTSVTGATSSMTLSGTNTFTGLMSVTTNASLTLSGDSSGATGGVTLNSASGILKLESAAALPTGTLTLQAGTLDNTVSTLTTAQPITFNGNFTFAGNSNLTFSNGAITNSGSRTITLNGTNSILTFGGVMTNTLANNQSTAVNGAGNTLVLGGYDIGNPTNTTNRTATILGNANVTITGPVTNGVGGATACLLTKNGTGTLTLMGANSYAGATTVNTGGELSLVGGSQQSAITVNSGAFIGFTLGSPTTSSAALNLQTGHVVRIHGTPVAPNSYTLITAASLGGTGIATPTLEAPITDYQLVVDGTALKLDYTGVISAPYNTWATGDEAFDADANGDGVIDGLAFLLGAGTPSTVATSLLPDVTETSGGLVMTFDCLSAAGRGMATLTLEYSSDLGVTDPWVSALVPGAAGSYTVGSVQFEITGTSPLSVTATIASGEAAGGKLFGRLKGNEN